MLELLKQPWHWSVAGVIIGLFVPLLLVVGNKTFGISSSMRHICAAILPAKISYFKYDWKKESWNLTFVAGVIIGGWIASHLLTNPAPIKIADSTKAYLQSIGIQEFGTLVPTDLFSWENLFTLRGFTFIVVGGFLVGFGTRYAGGCTSGHSIMGLSNLQLPSLIATICFMIGGFIVTWLVIPYL
ncbi:YeeE/YedE family protein [Emticicia sp. BO119]|uniref:YeeE/YedE family protein n=1 Tax=Emticicia sp. BO119 TaxID=2757768 RepID=UPI0015F0A07E|nr:YeeE/YedE thiosulfate transporter family protein [Emticicia sp. BO119]MBA4850975.1 YeeE/YedE family protein [Emticicia sp. BO119]